MHDNDIPDDQSFPESWLDDPFDFDPRIGCAWSDHKPGHALQCRIAAVLNGYVTRDPEAGYDIVNLACDAQQALEQDHLAIVKMLHGFLEFYATHVTGAIGEELAVERLQGELQAQREAARLDYGLENGL